MENEIGLPRREHTPERRDCETRWATGDDVAATEMVVEGKQVAGRGRRRGLEEEEVDSWPSEGAQASHHPVSTFSDQPRMSRLGVVEQLLSQK